MEEQLYPKFYAIEKEHWWFTARQEIVLRVMERHLPAAPTKRLLDVGCGTGALLEEFSKRYDARGIEPSPQAVAFCKMRGLANVRTGVLADHPVTEKMDILTFLDVVEHVDEDVRLLEEAHERLNSGGHVLITVPAYQWMWSIHDEVNHHKRRYTAETLGTVLQQAGFEMVHRTYFNSLLFPLAVAHRYMSKALGKREADEFEIPAKPLNVTLKNIFAMEKYFVPTMHFPAGLSLLCLGRKG